MVVFQFVLMDISTLNGHHPIVKKVMTVMISQDTTWQQLFIRLYRLGP